MILQAALCVHGRVRGTGRPDAQLGDGGLDGANGHVTTEDEVLLGLLPGVRLQKTEQRTQVFASKTEKNEEEIPEVKSQYLV